MASTEAISRQWRDYFGSDPDAFLTSLFVKCRCTRIRTFQEPELIILLLDSLVIPLYTSSLSLYPSHSTTSNAPQEKKPNDIKCQTNNTHTPHSTLHWIKQS